LPFTKISWDLSFSKHTSTGLDKNNPLKNHLLIKKGRVWAHKTSLTPPTCIEVSVQVIKKSKLYVKKTTYIYCVFKQIKNKRKLNV
jgi:hypothetical protein